ncbi:hypothetical protein D3C74_370440 [compost metagenome]
MDLQAEVRGLLVNLGFNVTECSDNLAYMLHIVYADNEFLDRTVLELLDIKIRTRNSYRFA